MRKLTLHLVLPLAILAFGSVTRWWHALPADARDTVYYGFPLPWIGEGWHTSGSWQVFLLEFLLDFLTYFGLCFGIVYLLHRRNRSWIPGRKTTLLLWSLSVLVIGFAVLVIGTSDPVWHLYRPYDMEVMNSGWTISWLPMERPEYGR